MLRKLSLLCLLLAAATMVVAQNAAPPAAQTGPRAHTDRTVRFKQIDRNGDGKLSLEEFVTRPEASNPGVPSKPDAKSRAERTARFQQADKDGDGFLTFEEFVALESIPVRGAGN